MQEPSDEQLVRCSSQGDRQAFTELACRYRGSLAALIRRLIPDVDAAEDVLQETLVQAWLAIGTVQVPERVHAWLLQVARNRCRDHAKSPRRREDPTDSEELETYMNRCGPAARRAAGAEDVEEAVHSLSSIEREAVDLFYLQGLTIKEISDRTGSPSGTVKCRLFTARHHLRSFLENRDQEEQ